MVLPSHHLAVELLHSGCCSCILMSLSAITGNLVNTPAYSRLGQLVRFTVQYTVIFKGPTRCSDGFAAGFGAEIGCWMGDVVLELAPCDRSDPMLSCTAFRTGFTGGERL